MKPMPSDDFLIHIKKVADHLPPHPSMGNKVSRAALYRWAGKGLAAGRNPDNTPRRIRLRLTKVGGRTFVRVADLKEFIRLRSEIRNTYQHDGLTPDDRLKDIEEADKRAGDILNGSGEDVAPDDRNNAEESNPPDDPQHEDDDPTEDRA